MNWVLSTQQGQQTLHHVQAVYHPYHLTMAASIHLAPPLLIAASGQDGKNSNPSVHNDGYAYYQNIDTNSSVCHDHHVEYRTHPFCRIILYAFSRFYLDTD